MSEGTARRVRVRDRAATAERILGAVGEVLAREGLAGIGINAIAKQARVDKVLIYRYFGGLPELLRAWGGSGRFWPRVQDLLGTDPHALLALPPAERYARFFEHFAGELRRRPLTLEILAGELQQRNELTVILETEREQWGEEAARVLAGDDWTRRPQLRGITLMLVAGVQYLLLRARSIRIFGGIDLRSDAGWDELLQSVRQLARALFDDGAPPPARAAGRSTPALEAKPASPKRRPRRSAGA